MINPIQKIYKNVADCDVEKCRAFHRFLFDFDGDCFKIVNEFLTLDELEKTAIDAARQYDFSKIKNKSPTALSEILETAQNAAKYGVAFTAFNIKLRSYAL